MLMVAISRISVSKMEHCCLADGNERKGPWWLQETFGGLLRPLYVANTMFRNWSCKWKANNWIFSLPDYCSDTKDHFLWFSPVRMIGPGAQRCKQEFQCVYVLLFYNPFMFVCIIFFKTPMYSSSNADYFGQILWLNFHNKRFWVLTAVRCLTIFYL